MKVKKNVKPTDARSEEIKQNQQKKEAAMLAVCLVLLASLFTALN